MNYTNKQLRIFINNINSYKGIALVDALRNDNVNDYNPHILIGTKCSKENNPVPKGVKMMFEEKSIKLLISLFMDCDVIIYDALDSDLDEIKLAIKTLQLGNYTDEKVFILISSVLAWSRTLNKEKKLTEDDQSQHQNLDEQVDEFGARYYPFPDSEYQSRKGYPKYEMIKTLENLCLNASNERPQLKSYVICSGIQYGNGEDQLYKLFRQAFIGDPPALPYYHEGRNIIPMIHIKDLAQFVFKTIEQLPQQTYIVAIDSSKLNTQKNIVSAISSTLGTGQVEQIPYYVGGYKEDLYDLFTLDIRLLPSKIYDFDINEQIQMMQQPTGNMSLDNQNTIKSGGEKTATHHDQLQTQQLVNTQITQQNQQQLSQPGLEQQQQQQEKGNQSIVIDKKTEQSELLQQSLQQKQAESFLNQSLHDRPIFEPMDWWSKEGFVENIRDMASEFLKYRKLRSIKILVSGVPAAGKTTIAKRLAEKFKIVYLVANDLIGDAKEEDSEFGEQLRSTLKEMRDKKVKEALELHEAEKKKNKGKKGFQDVEFDESKITVKVPDEFVVQIFKKRLNQNDCKFKGFILDYFPKSYQDAKGLFVNVTQIKQDPEQPPAEQDQQQQQQEQFEVKEELLQDLIPDNVIYLDGSDDFVKDRVKQNPPPNIENTHYTEEHMIRRLALFRKSYQLDVQSGGLGFFKEHNTDILSLNIQDITKSAQKQHDSLQQSYQEYQKALKDIQTQEEELQKQNQQDEQVIQELENKKKNLVEVQPAKNAKELYDEHIFEQILTYLERHGKFKTYVKFEEEEQNFKNKIIQQRLEKEQQEQESLKQKQLQEQADEIKRQQEAEQQAKLDAIKNAEKDLLDQRSQPVRQYLADLVVPYLTEGLIEVAKRTPEDPVDYLANFLMKKADLLDSAGADFFKQQ